MEAPVLPEGQAAVVRWQTMALVAGSVLAFTGTGMGFLSKRGTRMRSGAWWAAGMAGGLLTAAFAFPIAALEPNDPSIV